MVKVKNVRPGILIIADAGLKLGPGDVADIGGLTPQAEKAIVNGLLALVEVEPEAKQRIRATAKPHEQTNDAEEKPGVKEPTVEAKLNLQPKAQTPDEQTTVKSESGDAADISSLTLQAEKVIEDGPLVRIHSEPESREQAKVIAKGDELFLSDGKLPDAQIPAEQKPRLSQPVKSESGVKHGAG